MSNGMFGIYSKFKIGLVAIHFIKVLYNLIQIDTSVMKTIIN